MKKSLSIVLSSFLLALAMFVPTVSPVSADTQYVDLYAGNGQYCVGRVGVWADADYIYVQYYAYTGHNLIKTHLAVGVCDDGEIAGIPLTKSGNPKIGHFPYSLSLEPTREIEYQIPRDLSWTEGTSLCIAAHAVVAILIENGCGDLCEQKETAWGVYYCNPTSFPGHNWATYFCYTLTE